MREEKLMRSSENQTKTMGKKLPFVLLYTLLSVSCACAQSDNYPGTWQLQSPSNLSARVQATLRIGEGEKGVLFPACLYLSNGEFKAAYTMLLVKKSSRELAVSRNKYALNETPFTLGRLPTSMNGIFDYGRDKAGQPQLTLNRALGKVKMIPLADSILRNPVYRRQAESLQQFFCSADMVFSKINTLPWNDSLGGMALTPSASPVYFGLRDTVFVPTRDARYSISGPNKNDLVSVANNGNTLLFQHPIGKKTHQEELLLDTGLNILVLFADNFSSETSNKGKLVLEAGKKRFSVDFSGQYDSSATFIAVKVYYGREKGSERTFANYQPIDNTPLPPGTKRIGSILSTAQELTFAIWDDAVEDGDTISIKINGLPVATGFPVKKHPQFLTVPLKAGPNTITFIGENLGSIPPNTSVLEIIDGKRRKSFFLETELGDQRLLNIFYQAGAE
jgi:hypothetical protein